MHRKQDNLACQSILDRSVPEYKSIMYKSVGSTIVFSMNMALKCILTKILRFPPRAKVHTNNRRLSSNQHQVTSMVKVRVGRRFSR